MFSPGEFESGEPIVLDKTSDEFGTPDSLWLPLQDEFHFTVDAAASATNAKLPRYVTKEQNAFGWSFAGERVWCNPPYSKPWVEQFVRLAHMWTRNAPSESLASKVWVVLIPTRTEQRWFHELKSAAEIRFLKGRVKFIGGTTSARDNHMLMIFRSKFWAWW